MKLFSIFIALFFTAIMISACNGTSPSESSTVEISATPLSFPTFTPTNELRQPSATPLPLIPTFTPTNIFPTPEPAGFPFTAELSDALPKENLLLAVHFYADTVGHISGDEFCHDVGIYNDDTYIVISCMPDFTYPAPTGKLDSNQSKFLHRWVEAFQAFDEPSIHGVVKFAGTGNTVPGIADKVSMQALISELEWSAHQYVHRGGYPSVVFHTRTVLSNQLNLWLDNSSILKFEATDFPDSCLGAPKPGEVCEPMVTQGFRIYLVAQGMLYEYHTDIFGYDIRPFGEPQIAPTQRPGG